MKDAPQRAGEDHQDEDLLAWRERPRAALVARAAPRVTSTGHRACGKGLDDAVLRRRRLGDDARRSRGARGRDDERGGARGVRPRNGRSCCWPLLVARAGRRWFRRRADGGARCHERARREDSSVVEEEENLHDRPAALDARVRLPAPDRTVRRRRRRTLTRGPTAGRSRSPRRRRSTLGHDRSRAPRCLRVVGHDDLPRRREAQDAQQREEGSL